MRPSRLVSVVAPKVALAVSTRRDISGMRPAGCGNRLPKRLTLRSPGGTAIASYPVRPIERQNSACFGADGSLQDDLETVGVDRQIPRRARSLDPSRMPFGIPVLLRFLGRFPVEDRAVDRDKAFDMRSHFFCRARGLGVCARERSGGGRSVQSVEVDRAETP